MLHVVTRRYQRSLFVGVCFTFCFCILFLDKYSRLVKDAEYEFDISGRVEIDHFRHSDVNEVIARGLSKKVRILCWIMTSPKNLDGKATAVKNTWAKRCNKALFFSSETNASFPTIGLNTTEGRQHLTAKTIQAFRYCYEHYGNQFDWFLKADDDTYMIVENLRYFLSHHDPNNLQYFGHKFKVIVEQGYFSGGAGYILSRNALEKFVTEGLSDSAKCRQDGGAEDAEIGKCMQHLGIKAGDSLDIYGKETFHPFNPSAHLRGLYPQWFYNNAASYPKKGLECCSDYSISFHYMSPPDMYVMDYLIYHLRPYGIIQDVRKTRLFNKEASFK
ncbi:glycoprotein-N-acetylgalactosamine 3-beta-galactosyltransferase 1-like [Saccostrea echinata]|uniref:glycoprotein-N-acetylgalactosamine 3-beta-galactosyltransferase 1-like n=1 Tax=Saccostrea echinata TaxID=191078 RepID=UPI002A83A47A|nr:glycoprotein-N-acetylgalactosamine 3-beta-galactosyltransferase 1-like [Saccostrea echinata]XP_061182118.1 glycoprotein-N-acetylgalactosamine 3-beta-galactosyltransferase 1-like [Saccostrea echinata]